jgi:S1-C subfamily serine protease
MRRLFTIGLLVLSSVSVVRALDLAKIRKGEHYYPEVCLLPEKWLTKAMNLTCELLLDLRSFRPLETKPDRIGTGFVVDTYSVVTAWHVVDDCKEVAGYWHNHYVPAVGNTGHSNHRNDIALLKADLPFLTFAAIRTDNLILGEAVTNYGCPLFGHTSTKPTVSGWGAINNVDGLNNNPSFFQYDASTQPGNCGGLVLDEFRFEY